MAELEAQLNAWKDGIRHELTFWSNLIRTGGAKWPGDFNYRRDPNGRLQYEYQTLIDLVPLEKATILDVGSGPLTKIGKVDQFGKRPSITAVDPLAPFYNSFLEFYGVKPPVVTQQGFAEDLTALFPSSSFDLVTSINALDHSFEPMRAIFEMLDVCKVGGAVHLQHLPNEAHNENYVGFHQWNFDSRDGRFIIWNKMFSHDVANEIAAFASMELIEQRGGHVYAIMRKTAPVFSDPPSTRHRERLSNWMSAVLDVWGKPIAQEILTKAEPVSASA